MDMHEVEVQTNSYTIFFPLDPVGTGWLGVTRRDSGFHDLPDSTVVSAHTSSDIRGACCQEFCCWYFGLSKQVVRGVLQVAQTIVYKVVEQTRHVGT